MTPEGTVKKKIKGMLKEYGCYYYMPVSNGMGAPQLDFFAIVGGIAIGVEAKAPGKKPTARQELTMQEMRDAGGYACVCDGDMEKFEQWLVGIVLLSKTLEKMEGY